MTAKTAKTTIRPTMKPQHFCSTCRAKVRVFRDGAAFRRAHGANGHRMPEHVTVQGQAGVRCDKAPKGALNRWVTLDPQRYPAEVVRAWRAKDLRALRTMSLSTPFNHKALSARAVLHWVFGETYEVTRAECEAFQS